MTKPRMSPAGKPHNGAKEFMKLHFKRFSFSILKISDSSKIYENWNYWSMEYVYFINIKSEFENVLAPMCSYSTPKLIHMQRDRENIF